MKSLAVKKPTINRKITLYDAINDEEKLNCYIKNLENDLASSEKIDSTVSMLINNLLDVFSNFTDKRYLRASNIDAITNLLKFQSELPSQRIKTKKVILDLLTKKKELEIKEKAATAVNNMALNSGELLKSIFLKLDQQNIHPMLEESEILEAECCEIIEQPKLTEDTINELKDVDITKNIENLQTMLDSENIEEDTMNG